MEFILFRLYRALLSSNDQRSVFLFRNLFSLIQQIFTILMIFKFPWYIHTYILDTFQLYIYWIVLTIVSTIVRKVVEVRILDVQFKREMGDELLSSPWIYRALSNPNCCYFAIFKTHIIFSLFLRGFPIYSRF